MKVTVLGKPEDFIKKSRPEDILKYAKSEPRAIDEEASKNLNDIDFEMDER